MCPYTYRYEYLRFDNEQFFTVCLLPDNDGSFPTILCRSPYVSNTVSLTDDEVADRYLTSYRSWLQRGYAVVFQHCRGQGKSTGAFVPYVQENEDGLALRQWVRSQSFYNGELYLYGASYTASLHYATAPFEPDIKGAVFEVQDSQRYRLWYRNGQMRKGHANWHFGLYKHKISLPKAFDIHSFSQRPLASLSERVLGDRAEDFEQMLTAPSPEDPFWRTRYGGADTEDAVLDPGIPILLTTGYNDYYIGGVFAMWNRMTPRTKAQSALLVSPYNHGDSYHPERGLSFPNGKRAEAFGSQYVLDWFDHIRLCSRPAFEIGKVSYYRTFEQRWDSDFYKTSTVPISVTLGDQAVSFRYDPADPPAFCEEGQCTTGSTKRPDVIDIWLPCFDRDVFIKGQIRAVLSVSSDCPDTSFYLRVGIRRTTGTYWLRHDITSLSFQHGDYSPHNTVNLSFTFDEYAFLLQKGEQLHLCITSTDNNTYVTHTNRKGPYHLQSGSDIAVNTVYLNESALILPIECENDRESKIHFTSS